MRGRRPRRDGIRVPDRRQPPVETPTANAADRVRSGNKRWAVILFGASTFLFWVALYLYVPILPEYAESMGAGYTMVGAVIASYSIAQLLLRIPTGIWADLLGKRKPFVISGLLFATLGALAMAQAGNPWLLFAGRSVTGIAAASWVVSSVFFVSYFPPDKSSRGIGIISFVNSLAIVTATFIGGQFAETWGHEPVFLIAGALGVLGALLLLPVPEPEAGHSSTVSGGTLVRVLTHPVLLAASLMSLLVHFAQFATSFSFSLVYADRIGASSDDLGLVTAALFGSASLTSLATVYTIERWGYVSTILLGSVVMGVTILVTPAITDLGLFIGMQVVNGLGRGLLYPSFMSLSISAIAPEHRATAMGVHQAVYAIGMLTGPMIGGFAADGLGISSVFYISGAVVLLAGGMSLGTGWSHRLVRSD